VPVWAALIFILDPSTSLVSYAARTLHAALVPCKAQVSFPYCLLRQSLACALIIASFLTALQNGKFG
jgi:hypothetical protein